MTPLTVISLGAGVQSTTMSLMAAHGEIEPMPVAAIFADTGCEPKAVYDHLIRSGVRGTTEKLYLHRSLRPLDEVDFRNIEDKGQLNFFNQECDGMCGI